MSLSALLLLLVAALLHAGWNVLVKRAGEKDLFMWWAWVVSSLGYAPLLALLPALPRAAWPYVLASGLAQAVCSVALTRAYALGDFSLVYPLARGAAPALLLLWAVLFLGERPSLGGVLGIAVLLLGLLVVGGVFRRSAGRARLRPGAIVAALAVALCISIYSAVDGAGVQIAAPLPYTIAEFIVATLALTPVVLRRYSPAALLGEWSASWPRILAVGALILLTYALVLLAYSRGHVGYAGATREVSVVFAALIGWRWLGEQLGVARLAGSLLIFAGILLIALAG